MTDVKVNVVLTGIVADRPAMAKMAQWLAHSAFLGCGRCAFRGCHAPGTNKGMYSMGYNPAAAAAPAPSAPVPGVDCPCPLAQGVMDLPLGHKLAWDPSPTLTDAHHRARSAAVLAGARPNTVGCNGPCAFERLAYVDLSTLFTIPAAHVCLYGVVKDFWGYLLAPQLNRLPAHADAITAENRKLIRQRTAAVVLTSDFDRPVR